MTKSVGNVNVSITASMDAGFNQAFAAADKRLTDLGRTTAALSAKIADVGSYRKQQNALKDAARAYTEAKNKAAALRAEVAASETPTRKQTYALQKAETAARRAGQAYTDARTRLADMSRQLERSGVNVSKLSAEYRRLQTELTSTRSKHEAMEKSLARQQKFVQAMTSGWQKMQGFVVGAAAAAAVISRPVTQAMNWEERVMRLADTAGAGKSVGQKQAIQAQLSSAVTTAQKASHGKRDDIAGGLDALIGQGNMDPKEAAAMLPTIARAAFASNTSSEDVASIALKLKQFGVNDIGQGLDVIMRGGQAGGVEFKDMAKALPEQLAAARASGYSGNEGLAQVVAMNQLALRTAGDPASAANNVQNLLNKLITPELGKNVTKVTGVDFNKYKLQQRSKGVFAAEAFAQLADSQMSKNGDYQSLKKKLAGTKDNAGRSAILGDMSSLMEGSQMGQLIQDRQALAAALAMVYARKDVDPTTGKNAVQSMVDQVAHGQGGVAGSAEYLSTGAFAKATDASEAVNRANEGAYGAVSGPLGSLMDAATGLADAFPKLASAAYAATVALAAITAAGVGQRILTGGGGGAAGGAAAGAAAAAAGAARAGWLARVGRFAKGGLVAAAGGYAIDAGAGALGVGGKPINQEQDDANWAKMSTGQKVMSSIPRGIEKVGSLLFLDNIVNMAKSDRITAESDMVSKQVADQAKAGVASNQGQNVTYQQSFQLTVTAPAGSDPNQVAQIVNKALQDQQRKAAADKRSSLTDDMGH